MTDTHDTMSQQAEYEEACRRLGFDPSVDFVEVNADGSIGFSSGKPDEVRALFAAVRREGMRASRKLIDALRYC